MSDLDANCTALAAHLQRFQADGVSNWIGGERVPAASGATFTSLAPTDGTEICAVAKSAEADVNRAADVAAASFPAWRELAAAERQRILRAIADAIVDRAEEIALVESWDSGQPIRFMAKAALRGAENFRFFADRILSVRDGQALPSPTLLNVTGRVPIGPVAAITPWNTPFMLSTWKIAPALAAGCTVVHKPAELAPLSAQLLVEIAEGAGLPPGVLNVVHGFGEEAGRALTEHEAIRAVAFVGESSTGAAIMRQGAATLKRVHFELGGKNAAVVFEDADLDRALDAVVFMAFSLNGERCTASSRLLVHESVHDDFVRRVAERVGCIRVGHPLDPATEVGPQIHRNHVRKVRGYLELAESEGAELLPATAEADDTENYVRPRVLAGAKPDMRIAREEIFGPVLTVLPFRDEAEALAIANGTKYGLAGYVWTNDLTRALRFTDQMEAGMIWVNSENVRHLPTPFGGVKASGIGRDGGDWSFDFYTETKHIGFATGAHPIPKLGGAAQ